MATHHTQTGSPRRRRYEQRKQARRQALLFGAALAVLALILLVVLLRPRKAPDTLQEAAAASAQPTSAPVELVTAEPSPEPTPAPQETPRVVAMDRSVTRPTPTAPGFMPVFWESDTTEKIVAITVDDCFQADNLQDIVDAALNVGGRLTIFPIGQNAIKPAQMQVLKYAWENGMELENHTFTHNTLYACDDATMAAEIYEQQVALSYVLGLEYQCHFLRPCGGDARRDQRMQKYVEQLGYYGIAHWSVDGSRSSRGELGASLAPGQIYLFHTTDADRDTLVEFIPWIASQGYELVTLNEMFGYPENETAPMTRSLEEMQSAVPSPAPFETVLVPLKRMSYSWNAYLLQQKLIELGYLSGTPDGVYGADSQTAVSNFQRDHGLEVTGVADAATQQAIYGA